MARLGHAQSGASNYGQPSAGDVTKQTCSVRSCAPATTTPCFPGKPGCSDLLTIRSCAHLRTVWESEGWTVVAPGEIPRVSETSGPASTSVARFETFLLASRELVACLWSCDDLRKLRFSHCIALPGQESFADFVVKPAQSAIARLMVVLPATRVKLNASTAFRDQYPCTHMCVCFRNGSHCAHVPSQTASAHDT